MGKKTTTSADLATIVAEGTIAATGVATFTDASLNSKVSFVPRADFNFSVWNGTVGGTASATYRLERSFDGGTTWLPYTYVDGSALTWTGAASTPLSESEAGVLWRPYCTAFTAGTGTVNWRLSQ